MSYGSNLKPGITPDKTPFSNESAEYFGNCGDEVKKRTNIMFAVIKHTKPSAIVTALSMILSRFGLDSTVNEVENDTPSEFLVGITRACTLLMQARDELHNIGL